MKKRPKQKAKVVGEYFTHNTLWRTAKRFLDDGRAEPKGSFYPFLASVVFAYFAFEAFLNTALREVDPDTWKNERRFFSRGKYRGGTMGKFRFLALKSGAPFDVSSRPVQTLVEMTRARNFLAHARVDEYDVVVAAERLDDPKWVQGKLDQYSSEHFATRAIEDIEKAADALVTAFGVGHKFCAAGHAFSGLSHSWKAKIVSEKLGGTPRQVKKAPARTRKTVPKKP